MIPKPVHEIKFPDLKGLIGVARESKTLEFKLQMPGTAASDFVPFLAGVSSLANSAGGAFVLGVAAKDALAEAVPGCRDTSKRGLIHMWNGPTGKVFVKV
jgi:predicted HTH transcriptional regulator